MTAPASLEEALAQCKAQSLGKSACADLISPFCPGDVQIDIAHPFPFCVSAAASAPDSPQKAAILLSEAEAKAAANAPNPPWLLIGAGVAAVALVLYAISTWSTRPASG